MKKYKEIVKRIGAVTLAAALAVTMAPVQRADAEEAETAQAQDVQVQETETETSEETVQPDGFVEEADKAAEGAESNTENATEDLTEEAEADVTEQQKDVPSETAQEDTSTAEGIEKTAEAAVDAQAEDADNSAVNEDINRPVIEKVEFESGQTFREGDTVEIRVYAYDSDSGIERVDVDYIEDSDDENEDLGSGSFYVEESG